MIDRIAGPRGILAGQRSRVALIVRQEMNRAYDAGNIRAAEEIASADPGTQGDPLLHRAFEALDNRNHPFSRAIDGMAVRVGKPWRVPVAEVRSWGSKLKRGVGGVHWPIRSGHYVGSTYPAHFNDRGRRILWRERWGAAS